MSTTVVTGETTEEFIVPLTYLNDPVQQFQNSTLTTIRYLIAKVDRWMDGWMDGWLAGWLAGWLDGWMDGRTDGRTDVRAGRSWADRRTDGQIEVIRF